jgi:glycosyltransferase involved in cell wall biosynthesis
VGDGEAGTEGVVKVLVAHNRYRSDQPSGENVVVDAEIAALREAGVEVVAWLPSSDDIDLRSPRGLIEAAAGPIRAPWGSRTFAALLRDHRPDVVHLHNVYPLIGPQVVKQAHQAGLPVVMTVHNFRLDCVNGLYFRDGRVCTDCQGLAFASPAVQHACYRGSRAQTLPMVVGRSAHRNDWLSVDRFFALTEFHAEFLRMLGVPAESITVRPTSAPDPGPPTPPGRDVLFVGRLDEAKGIDVLLDAWARSTAKNVGRRLLVVGDGPLRGLVERAGQADTSISVYGAVDREEVGRLMNVCGVVVIPSIWFEGLPRVLVEALACGRGVIASDMGGLAAALPTDAGVLVEAQSPQALADALSALADPVLQGTGAAARAAFVANFDEANRNQALVATYRELSGQP